MNVEYPLPQMADEQKRTHPIARWLSKYRWFALVVILPTLLAMVYYGLVASDIYVSEARFVIKSPDQKRPQVSSLANLIQTTGLSSGQEQANEVLEFVRSRDALQNLQKNANIRSRYHAPESDFLSRFPGLFQDSSFEDLYKYYTKMVSATLDTENGTAVIKAKAFTPEDAYVINSKLLAMSEEMVNRLNQRAEGRAVAEASRQVQIAQDRANAARSALTGYRNSSEIIDPAKQAGGTLEISGDLIGERAAMQAQLEVMEREAPRNPAIPTLRKRVAALSAQIDAQNRQVVGSGSSIASKMNGYEKLLDEQKFATESLNAANASLVQAHADAARQKFYLERIVNPNRPDAARLPSRLMGVLVVLAAALCLYFIGWMLIVGILEHAPEK